MSDLDIIDDLREATYDLRWEVIQLNQEINEYRAAIRAWCKNPLSDEACCKLAELLGEDYAITK